MQTRFDRERACNPLGAAIRRALLMSLLWVFSGVVGLTAQAADVRFGGILPDGALLTQKIQSMTDLKFQNVIRQHYDFSCGAASLATILRYGYGLNITENTVLYGMLGVSNPELVRTKGFSLLDMKNYLAELGYRGRGYRVDLERLNELSVPTIVLINVNGFNHFVVLKRVLDGYVYIADPALGNRRYRLDRFFEMWPSRVIFAVIGPGFDRHTALLSTETVSARALQERSGEVPRAELLGFGFTHADLF